MERPRSRAGTRRRALAAASVVWIALAAGLGIVGTGLSEAGLPAAARDRWIRVETPHFTCYTNGNQAALTDLLLELERLREALHLTTSGLDRPSAVPTYFLAFEDMEAFLPYNMRRGPGEAQVIGQFQGAPDVHYLVFGIPTEDDSKHVIYHEFMHSVLRNNVPGIPLWLNEGLAEYYSTFESTARSAEIGKIIEYHLAVLQAQPLVPLRNLFAVQTESHRYTDPGQSALFYAESWALVHMLASEPGGADRLRSYLAALREGQDPTSAFAASFGSEPAVIEERLRQYVRRDDFSYTQYSFRKSFDKLTSTSHAINSKEILTLLGDVQLRQDPSRIDEAREHFRAALAIDALYAPALLGLGYAAELEGDEPDALRNYRLALESAPDDPRALYFAGQAIAGEYFRTPGQVSVAQETPPELLEARALLERSLEGAPGQPEALAALGKTYLFAWREDARPGVWALREALDVLPRRADLWVQFITLTARSGNRDAAVSMLHGRLAPLGDAESVEAAWTGIAQADLRAATELIERGESDAAVHLLDRSIATIEGTYANRILIETRAALRTSSEHNEYVDLYNEALAHLRDRNFEPARIGFERVAARAPSPELRAEAEARLEDIRFLEGTATVVRWIEDRRYGEADRLLDELESMTLRPSQYDYLRGLRVALEQLQ